MTKASIGDAITVAALEADPYPIYRALRVEEPVAWVGEVGLWLVTRWDEVQEVTLNHEVFTAALPDSPLSRTLGPNMMHAGRDYHRPLRAIVEPLFRPAGIRRYVDDLIPRLAEELIADFAGQGEVELIAAFAEPLSVRALKHVLGLAEVPDERLMAWFNGIATGVSNFEADPAKQAIADRASAELHEALKPILARLRHTPDESILSRLASAEIDGRMLTRAEIEGNLKLMMIGGMQEPRDVVGLAVWALLSHPEQGAALVANLDLIKRAVEETLRWSSPVGTLTRLTTRPTTLAGVALPAGARVAAVIASANRDERHWSDPDRFDLARTDLGHLAFGAGDHFCVGAWLGRAVSRVALRLLFERLPGLCLDEDRPAVVKGWEFRGVEKLWVRWGRPPTSPTAVGDFHVGAL